MKIAQILFLIFICIAENFSQSLIPNGDFESYTYCPKRYLSWRSDLKKCLGNWYSPTFGTPDYFNKCSRTGAGVPKNEMGISIAKSGNGYVGFILIDNPLTVWSKSDFLREYIATEINLPLEKDSFYRIGFYITLADFSLYTTDEIGILFSEKRIKQRTNLNITYIPQIIINTTSLNNDSTWVLISGCYKAKGGERYIAIGNFEEPGKQFWTKRNLKIRKELYQYCAYYYLDSVFLRKVNLGCP